MMKISKAVETIGKDPQLREMFKGDPKKVLTELGVDTARKTVKQVKLSDSDLEAVSVGPVPQYRKLGA